MMEIADQIEQQRLFFASGVTKSYNFRINSLKRLKESIMANGEGIMKALWHDLRKSEFESYATEISIIIGELNYAIKHLRRWTKAQKRATPWILFPSTSKIVKEPYGVALIISPWNYPFQLIISPLIGAIAAGNCAILKPSPAAAATAKILHKIIEETFSQEYILLLNGENKITNQLLEQRFDYIFYTGAVSYGKEVAKAAAQFLTPLTLELGGKSPCIVDKDANIKIAARRIVWGKFLNCGQTCVAPDYLMVHNDIKEQLIESLKSEIVRQFGKEIKSSPDYTRIINQSRFQQLSHLIEQGTIVFGGETDEHDCYISPTLLDNIDLDTEIMNEEIFGPLLPIIGFDDLETVIDYVNSKEKPLALYYFTESRRQAKVMIDRTSSGGACINDVVIHVANTKIPFGGVGQSGMGGYHGHYSFDTFSHIRSVMSSSTKIDIGVKFAPYKDKIKLLKSMI